MVRVFIKTITNSYKAPMYIMLMTLFIGISKQVIAAFMSWDMDGGIQ